MLALPNRIELWLDNLRHAYPEAYADLEACFSPGAYGKLEIDVVDGRSQYVRYTRVHKVNDAILAGNKLA